MIRFEEGVDYEVQTEAYSMFRMVTDATGLLAGPVAFFQLGEIELFGTEGDVTDPVFRRGEADQNGNLQLTDAVQVLSYLFLGVPTRVPDCFDASDADDNGFVQLTDAIRILGFLFLGGPAPPAPGPTDCGADPTEDAIGCAVYDC